MPDPACPVMLSHGDQASASQRIRFQIKSGMTKRLSCRGDPLPVKQACPRMKRRRGRQARNDVEVGGFANTYTLMIQFIRYMIYAIRYSPIINAIAWRNDATMGSPIGTKIRS